MKSGPLEKKRGKIRPLHKSEKEKDGRQELWSWGPTVEKSGPLDKTPKKDKSVELGPNCGYEEVGWRGSGKERHTLNYQVGTQRHM